MLNKQFKEDLKKYLKKGGWDNFYVFDCEGDSDSITPSYFKGCAKGIYSNIHQRWLNNEEETDKYLLEYIGPILRKHKIKTISIDYRYYESEHWEFGNIRQRDCG